ncbi:MAG TPA: DUF72 domain-containing protein [Sphingomicrobium sp.]|nr:DUF72 domain-containing protein [Sphingomicrobium sp.]
MRIGTAGWGIGRDSLSEFPATGSVLERYSARFSAVEINSSFHRPHGEATWSRWRDAVPGTFRFSVKIPKEISHLRKLRECDGPLDLFLGQVRHLGEKLGLLLLQLPPKLEFEVAHGEFLKRLSGNGLAKVVCEPRHPSWFTPEADQLLRDLTIARVAADPAITPAAAEPGGWDGLSYFRLHGSPVMYRSSYADRIEALSVTLMGLENSADDLWCIFDNTASSAATSNALSLLKHVKSGEW